MTSRPTGDSNNSIFLYDTRGAKLTRVTTGYLNDTQPVFDPDGTYLYYASDREFTPVYGAFDNSWTYPNPTRLMAVPLRGDVRSPLYTRNDYEGAEPPKKPEEAKADAAQQAKPSEVEIDVTDFEARAVVLPPPAGNYADLQATKGRLLYRRLPRSGSSETKSPIVFFDFNEREEKTVLEDAAGFEVTADGKKMLAAFQGRFAILEIKSPQKFEKPIATAEMEAPVDPRAEWKQMFEDTYRFYRDYGADSEVHRPRTEVIEQ